MTKLVSRIVSAVAIVGLISEQAWKFG